jgi:hypothetical protein
MMEEEIKELLEQHKIKSMVDAAAFSLYDAEVGMLPAFDNLLICRDSGSLTKEHWERLSKGVESIKAMVTAWEVMVKNGLEI